MEKSQTTLLLELAKKLQKENSSKEKALETLNAAGILDKDGNFTKNFSNLARVQKSNV